MHFNMLIESFQTKGARESTIGLQNFARGEVLQPIVSPSCDIPCSVFADGVWNICFRLVLRIRRHQLLSAVQSIATLAVVIALTSSMAH